jgi:hypothetical protein
MSVTMHDEEHGYPTVRRYSRSLSEAFPDVRAQSVEPWQKDSASQSARQLIPQVLGFALALLAAALLLSLILPR